MVSNYKRKTNKGSYSKETLREAVRAVKNGNLSGYKAAKIYDIPRMTIMDHVNDKRTKSNSLGRNTALSLEVEQKLASCLHLMEKHGFGLSKAEMIESVAEYVQKNKLVTPFKNNVPGNSWFSSFKKRHNLSIKKPQAVEYARKKAMNPFIVYPYFDTLQDTLQDLNLLDKPAFIWNMDETNFSKDPEKTKIVGAKGHAATRVIASTGKENTTVLLGVNALGEKLPPLIVYKGAYMWNGWTSPEGYPGTTYAATRDGWMETEVFEKYFKKIFLPAVGDRRPVLLIYDGHATHVGINLIEEARKANITILKLPAHSSHCLQPLDVSVMKSFKDRWDQWLVKWQRLNTGLKLPKRVFAKQIGNIWAQIPSEIISNGFRKTGIYPFNPEEIQEKLFDSLKLQQWKDLQKKPETENLNNLCTNCTRDMQIDRLTEKSSPKTLLSLALSCIIEKTEMVTNECQFFHDCDREHHILCDDVFQNIPTRTSPSFNNDQKTSTPTQKNKELPNEKKIQVLEDRTVTIEELILMKLNTGSHTKVKRTRVGPGAEVLTHDDVFKRKIEEKTRNIKKEPGVKKSTKESKKSTVPQKIAVKRKHEQKMACTSNDTESDSKGRHVTNVLLDNYISTPGPSCSKTSPICKQRPKTITKKGKGIGKKTQKIKPQKKRKRARVASDNSTSVSDSMSIYSDDDLFDNYHEETLDVEIENHFTHDNVSRIISEQAYLDNYRKQDEKKEMESSETEICGCKDDLNSTISSTIFDLFDNDHNHEDTLDLEIENHFTHDNVSQTISEQANLDNYRKLDAKTEIESSKTEICGSNDDLNSVDDLNSAISEKNNPKEYEANDTVLVRYFQRKKWIYYVGFVEAVLSSEDEMFYRIRYYKTAKNPLKFVLAKKIDRDDVPSLSIVKKINLCPNPNNNKELFLYNVEDVIYFS